MEAFGTVLFFILLGLGILLLLLKKYRRAGIIIMLISLVFLYLIPTYTFWCYKKNAAGFYSDKKGTDILISADGTYKILFKGKPLNEGAIIFKNTDAYSFSLNNNPSLVSIHEGEITQFENNKIIFFKK